MPRSAANRASEVTFKSADKSSVFSGMKEDKGQDHEDQPGGCSKQRGRKWQKPVDQLVEVCDLDTNNIPAAAVV